MYFYRKYQFRKRYIHCSFFRSGTISNIFIVALRLPFSFQQSLSGETFQSAFIPTLGSIEGKDSVYKRHQFAKYTLDFFSHTISYLVCRNLYASYIKNNSSWIFRPSKIFIDGFMFKDCFSLFDLHYVKLSFFGLLNYRNKFSLTALFR